MFCKYDSKDHQIFVNVDKENLIKQTRHYYFFNEFSRRFYPKRLSAFRLYICCQYVRHLCQMRHKYILSFINSGKLSNITSLWVAKVCESLGLAVNLKECFRDVFNQWDDYQVLVCARFYLKKSFSFIIVEVYRETNKGDLVQGPQKNCCCCSLGWKRL